MDTIDWSHAAVRRNLYVTGGMALLLLLVISISFMAGYSKSSRFEDRIRGLLRESLEWSSMSKQDGDPFVSLQHSTFALASLRTARRLATDAEIEAIAEQSVVDFSSQLERQYDLALGVLKKSNVSVSKMPIIQLLSQT
jgi:hypothetical protein